MTDGGALAGIRVVDVGSVVAGPWAATWLADQGADVIMVEPVDRLDVMRRTGPMVEDQSGVWVQLNRNKRAIRLDLRHPTGREIVLRLVDEADVFSQNMRPGVIERLGLGYDELARRVPELIYLSVSGFGPDGPYADQPVYDPVIQALSGLADVQNTDYVKSIAADKITAMTAANGVLAALLARARGQGGQHVQVNMLDAVISWLWADGMWNQSIEGVDPVPTYSDWYAPYDTKDGAIACIFINAAQFIGLLTALDALHLADDPRFATREARVHNNNTMREEIAAQIARWPRDEILARLRANDVPSAAVLPREAVADDPQVRHNGTVVELTHADGLAARVVRSPIRLSATPSPSLRPAPDLGQHTDEVLADLGYDDAECARLRAEGVIG